MRFINIRGVGCFTYQQEGHICQTPDGSLLDFFGFDLIIEWDLETCSRGVVKDRSRFNQNRIQQLEKTLTVDMSKGWRTYGAN